MQQSVSTDVEFWSSRELIQLRADIQHIPGGDGRRLLKTADAKYIAVPASAESLLDLLVDGTTGHVIFNDLLNVSEEDAPRAHQKLTQFLNALRQNNVLNVPPDVGAEEPTDGFLHRARADFFKRIPLSHQFGSTLAGIGTRIGRLPLAIRAGTAAIVAVGLLVWLVWLVHESAFAEVVTLQIDPLALVCAGAVLIANLCIHECCHAVAMGFHRLEVREMGIGLALYVAPVAYVDRGAVYTLKSRVGRITIALAGPLCDVVMIFLAATLATTLHGLMSNAFSAVVIAQSYLLAINLNPLFRTDGYHALEALLGASNMRSRAIAFAVTSILRMPQPSYLENVSSGVKVGYLVYLFLGIGCVIVLLGIGVAGVLHTIGAL